MRTGALVVMDASGGVGAVESTQAAAPSTARREKQSFFIGAPSQRSQAFSLGGVVEGRNYFRGGEELLGF
jgi:hypothetical protein